MLTRSSSRPSFPKVSSWNRRRTSFASCIDATGSRKWCWRALEYDGLVSARSGSKLADGVPARASPWCCISSRPPTTAIRRSHPVLIGPEKKSVPTPSPQ